VGSLFDSIAEGIESGMKLKVSFSPSPKFKYSVFFNFCSGLPAHFAPWSASNQERKGEVELAACK
jgi:hypothetical protein